MACLNYTFAPPQIPPILLPNSSFVINLDYGTVGITCCSGKLPGYQQPLTIPIPPSILNPEITAINALLQAAIELLDQIDLPDCGLNTK